MNTDRILAAVLAHWKLELNAATWVLWNQLGQPLGRSGSADDVLDMLERLGEEIDNLYDHLVATDPMDGNAAARSDALNDNVSQDLANAAALRRCGADLGGTALAAREEKGEGV